MRKLKKTSILITLLTSAFVLSGCRGFSIPTSSNENVNSAISSSSMTTEAHVREPELGMIIVKQRDEAVPKDGLTFKVDTLNKEFFINYNGLSEKNTNKVLLSSVYTLFLVDVNKDGYHDFIYTTGSGRSMSAAGVWIGVYDYHNGKELYRLDDPNEYDYRFLYEDHKIIVEQYITDYYRSKNILELNRLVGKGILDYSNPDITTNWQNFLKADSFDFKITLANEDRTPVTLKQGEEKDTYIVEHARVDDAYCITTSIVRNSGNYDDLTTDLPVGYRLNGDYRLVQATANNHQDNVVVSLDPAELKYQDKKAAIVEVCVSGYTYKILFEYDSLDYSLSTKTLKQVFGWTFEKEDIIEFSHEYIPGSYNNPYSEEMFPFVYVSISNSGEATQESYKILEGRVANIDPALVKRNEEASRYFFKTEDNTYTFSEHHAFIECDGAFYLIIYSKDYSYALSSSISRLHFRDSCEEVLAQPNIPGESEKIIKNANKIIFQSRDIPINEKAIYVPENARYFIEIAGNKFYILDSKTMFTEYGRYQIVSDLDFSDLF